MPDGVQTLVIEGWVPAQESNGPQWSRFKTARARKMARVTTWASVRHAGWVPVEGKARLVVTFVFPQRRRRDELGLHSRTKGIQDGLVDAGILADDDTEHLHTEVRAEVEKGRKATELRLSVADHDGRG